VTAEDASQDISRGCCDRRSVRDVLLLASHRQNNAVALGSDNVRANLIQIEHNSSDVRSGAVLRRPDLPHAVGVHRDTFRVVVTDRVRKIQQDAFRIHRRIHRWLYRGTDRDFNS
jgi:hypothetical protein